MASSTEIGDLWNLFQSLRVDEEEDDPHPKEKEGVGTEDSEDGVCEFCGSMDIVLEEGNYTCKTCHSLTNRFIDSSAEWRYYGAEDSKGSDPTRCGMPVNQLMPNASLGTVIGYGNKESWDMRIIKKYHTWNSVTYKDRVLFQVFENITTNASNSGIPSAIIEEAKALYKKVSENKITRGENKSGLIASSIYMSCKTNKVPRSTKEIAKIFNIKVTTMTKGCKKFQDILKMNVNSTCPVDFIQRFTSKLNLTHEVRELCKHVVLKAGELNVASENTPPSVAAGSIYMCIVVCGLAISKKDLSAACGISPVTITKCYKKLHEHRGVLLPKDVILKYHVK